MNCSDCVLSIICNAMENKITPAVLIESRHLKCYIYPFVTFVKNERGREKMSTNTIHRSNQHKINKKKSKYPFIFSASQILFLVCFLFSPRQINTEIF